MHVEKRRRVYLEHGTAVAAAVIHDSRDYAATYPEAITTGALPYVWLGDRSRDYGVYVELTGYEVLDVVRCVLNHRDPWIRNEFLKLFDKQPSAAPAKQASAAPVEPAEVSRQPGGSLLPTMPTPPHLR